jgi:hypothetical protein
LARALELAISAHLIGLEHDDFEARRPQIVDHLDLVTAAGLKPNASHAVTFKKGDQLPAAILRIVAAQFGSALRYRAVQLRLADINPCTNQRLRVSFAHLRRPCLVSEPKVPATYPGPMKRPVAILLLPSPKGSGGDDPTTDPPAPGGRPGQDIPHGIGSS